MTDADDVAARINAVVARYFGIPPGKGAGNHVVPFDIGKPTSHSFKQEWIAETGYIETVLAHVDALLEHLQQGLGAGSETNPLASSVRRYMDDNARSFFTFERIERPFELVVENFSKVGVTFPVLALLYGMQRILRKRMQELKEEGEEFWSGTGRPPDPFARAIALRLAHLLVTTGPELGVDLAENDSGIAIKYRKALSEIFRILEIDADPRRPSQWALEKVREEQHVSRLAADFMQALASQESEAGPVEGGFVWKESGDKSPDQT